MPPKMVILMRKDLNMRKGKMVAQGAHSAMLGMVQMLQLGPSESLLSRWWDWVDSGMTKICVGVDSLEQLEEIGKRARDAGLEVQVVTDAGRTEFGGVPTVTCMAIGPNDSDQIDAITGELKLL
jgi:peptidyl-tRNA hydrolase, PTH2 family